MWYSLQRGGGNPPADTILGTGTNLAFQALSDTTTGASGIPHGGNVGGFKVLLNAAAQTAAATTAPCVLMLVDLLGFYPITTVTTTTAQTLNNTVTLPRYTDGAGVQAFLTPSTVMGAATPNLSIGYTNSAGTAGRATPTTGGARDSVYGGAGGGAGSGTAGERTAGASLFGGNGGAGGDTTNGTAGTAPGGGGGGTRTGTSSGGGARGQVDIWGVV